MSKEQTISSARARSAAFVGAVAPISGPFQRVTRRRIAEARRHRGGAGSLRSGQHPLRRTRAAQTLLGGRCRRLLRRCRRAGAEHARRRRGGCRPHLVVAVYCGAQCVGSWRGRGQSLTPLVAPRPVRPGLIRWASRLLFGRSHRRFQNRPPVGGDAAAGSALSSSLGCCGWLFGDSHRRCGDANAPAPDQNADSAPTACNSSAGFAPYSARRSSFGCNRTLN